MATRNIVSSINIIASGNAEMADVTLAIASVIAISSSGSANLVTSTKPIICTVAISASGTVEGILGLPLEITATIDIVAAGAANGIKSPQITATIGIVAAGAARLSAKQPIVAAIATVAGGSVNPTIDGQGLLVRDAAKNVLAMWGHSCCATADACLLSEIIGYINAALQLIFSNASRLDYFNKKTIVLTCPPGDNNVPLGDTIQALLGPVREATSKRTLIPLQSLSEMEGFVDYYYAGQAPPEPRAYYLDARHRTSGDNVSLSLLFVPAPSSDTGYTVEAALLAPRYTTSDIDHGTPLEIPHRYAELLLFPLVRKWASGNRLFTRQQLQPQIDEQYAAAQLALGLVQPEIASLQEPKIGPVARAAPPAPASR
jgi:hypothetical protein